MSWGWAEYVQVGDVGSSMLESMAAVIDGEDDEAERIDKEFQEEYYNSLKISGMPALEDTISPGPGRDDVVFGVAEQH